MEIQDQESTDVFEKLQELYENRAMEERGYTFDHFCKVLRLRYEAEKQRAKKHKDLEDQEKIRRYQIGDRVRFQYLFDGRSYTLNGHIANIDGTNLDIENSIGLFKNIPRWDASFSPEKDWSHVSIPEELKKVDTKLLLNKFKYHRTWEYPSYVYDSWGYDNKIEDINQEQFEITKGVRATLIQMKAELSTREHIFSSAEIKMKKYLSSK